MAAPICFGDDTVKVWDAATGECIQTLNIGTSLSTIAFDPTGSYLLTEVGPVMLCQSSFVLETQSESSDANDAASAATVIGAKTLQTSQGLRRYSYGLSSDRSWITWHGLNVLWLPLEYRPSLRSCSAISGTTVAIGCASGRVLIIGFLPTVSPIGS